MENAASRKWKAAVSRSVTQLEKGMHFTTESKEHLVECYEHGCLEYVTKGFVKTLFEFTPQYLLIVEPNALTERILCTLQSIIFCYKLSVSDRDIAMLGHYVFAEVEKACIKVRESGAFDYSPDL